MNVLSSVSRQSNSFPFACSFWHFCYFKAGLINNNQSHNLFSYSQSLPSHFSQISVSCNQSRHILNQQTESFPDASCYRYPYILSQQIESFWVPPAVNISIFWYSKNFLGAKSILPADGRQESMKLVNKDSWATSLLKLLQQKPMIHGQCTCMAQMQKSIFLICLRLLRTMHQPASFCLGDLLANPWQKVQDGVKSSKPWQSQWCCKLDFLTPFKQEISNRRENFDDTIYWIGDHKL